MLSFNEEMLIPRRVYLDVTNFCLLNCKHCYANAGKAASDELSLSELKDLAKQISDFGVIQLVISGGEPLARKDIFDFLSFCSEKGLKITLLTNGILMDQFKSKILNDFNVEVRVSIDGVTSKTHDYVRGKGNFAIVRQSLKTLKDAKIKGLSVHFTANRLNIEDILVLPYFLNELGILDVVVGIIKPAGRTLQNRELLIEPALILLVKERLATIYRNKSINFHFHNDKNWEGLACPAAYSKCGISSDGRISPCVFLGADYLGGSVRNYSFEYLWRNDAILNRLRNLSINNCCAECSQIDSCNGGCRLRATHYNGNLEATDPYCCEMKKQKTLLADSGELFSGKHI